MKQAPAEGLSDEAPLPELASRELAERIAALAWEKKAEDVRVLRVRELVQYTDWFVVMSATSDRHAAALRQHIERSLRTDAAEKPMAVEGGEQNQWVVMDYSDVVVHIFYEPVRAYYELERLWREAPELTLSRPDDAPAAG
ncbi:MAG: ribosome silencing factor [Deltaproteobacteria bacterium]|nr:ribosome silencing factor [Deltaproteobacteria bacterium]MCB9787257.1 ribosome silencing factor [Deltaproteobacteria bacterium]